MDEQHVKALDKIGAIYCQYGEPPTPVNILTEEEIGEIFRRSNEIASLFNVQVSNTRWMIHFDMICHMVSLRYFKSKKCFIGACILNSITCFWDDIQDNDIDDDQIHLILEQIRNVCEEYYPREAIESVYSGTKQWIKHDGFFRHHSLKGLLCQNDVSYWLYRVIDSGTHYSLKITAPIYENSLFTDLVDINLISQLANRPYMVVNDLCSYYKEQTFEEIANFLTYTKDIDNQIEGVAYDMKCISTLDSDVQKILIDKIYGHYIYGLDLLKDIRISSRRTIAG